jgi:hypothetical protein
MIFGFFAGWKGDTWSSYAQIYYPLVCGCFYMSALIPSAWMLSGLVISGLSEAVTRELSMEGLESTDGASLGQVTGHATERGQWLIR